MPTHRQRIEACLSQSKTDRVPIALWRHFPVDDQEPHNLAAATLHFQRTFDFDLVKVTPASSYCLKDWGARDEWRGSTEGTREYTQFVIQHPEDWSKLKVLDPRRGYLADQLQCLRLLTKELEPDTPVLQTIFNPLSQAKNLVGTSNLLIHLHRYPDALHIGLKTIAESTRLFIEAALESGISGIFFAVQHAQYSLISSEEYHTFGRAYDLLVIEPAQNLWLNMLHIHGNEVMFKLFLDYPVKIINWHDRETSPSLSEGKAHFQGAVCGGIQRQTLTFGTPNQVREEARRALEETEKQRLILGTGCVVPLIAPYGNILALRQCLE